MKKAYEQGDSALMRRGISDIIEKDSEHTKKIYGKASVISTDLYNQTFINNISYINMDNNDWIKDNNEYITIGMNKEIVNSDYAKTYITIKLNNNIIVTIKLLIYISNFILLYSFKKICSFVVTLCH